MLKKLRRLMRKLRQREVVHFIPGLPIGMELSDGDKAALYGWPDRFVKDVQQESENGTLR